MMSLPDYYAMLGLPASATLTEIKRAYRRLARLYHPDLNGQPRDDRIKQLNEAYGVLRDATKRATYDKLLLEERQAAVIAEMIRRRQEEAEREAQMTWKDGIVGFVRELKKGLQEE
ncbi:MAG TPA: DnaJ domain-containing protein [Ktedonobacteraceae bacterium]|nr:DnaJ domain-containing protein [Ktedonobacteraceae bacterium]